MTKGKQWNDGKTGHGHGHFIYRVVNLRVIAFISALLVLLTIGYAYRALSQVDVQLRTQHGVYDGISRSAQHVRLHDAVQQENILNDGSSDTKVVSQLHGLSSEVDAVHDKLNDLDTRVDKQQKEQEHHKLISESHDSKVAGQLEGFGQELSAVKEKLQNLDVRTKSFPEVKFLSYKDRKRILITGGAGFVGSHLVDSLMLEGHEVTVIDNFFTGRKQNVEHWIGHENFELLNHDVIDAIHLEVDEIYHLASPASPPHYMYNPIKTIKTNTVGTINMLGLAKRVKAKLLLASTSEVYGDPEEHPQKETYWGHVNPNGPRACYDEGKRVAETMCFAYQKQSGVQVRVARIFNTFGPRMHMNDGRVVSNFILQALQDQPMTIYGEGKQTRSFQYVSDLVSGLIALMNSNFSQPVNLGNPEEHTIKEFAEIIQQLVGGKSEIVFKNAMQDDPQRRKPDIKRAKEELFWQPMVPMREGLQKTIEYFREELKRQQLSKHKSWMPAKT